MGRSLLSFDDVTCRYDPQGTNSVEAVETIAEADRERTREDRHGRAEVWNARGAGVGAPLRGSRISLRWNVLRVGPV
jgi:hypothetical protein